MLLYVVQPANSESCTKGEDQDDEDLCIVCWEREREVIFCDCMHMVRPRNSEAVHLWPICAAGCHTVLQQTYSRTWLS